MRVSCHRRRNSFLAEGAKINDKQSTNSKYNFMQCVFFHKRYMRYSMGSGAKPPEACKFREYTVYKVTYNCKLQKKMGVARDITCSPNNSAPRVSATMQAVLVSAISLCLVFLMYLVYNLHKNTRINIKRNNLNGTLSSTLK